MRLALLCAATILLSSANLSAQRKSRFFYNDDGDRAVFLLKGPFHKRQLNYPVDVLVGTGITTLVYCANFGSDQAYYPTKVASPLGWREVENTRRNKRFTYFNRVHEIGALLRKKGIDLLGTVKQRALQQGLEFIPSLRMNDIHFLQKEPPLKHPLTGKFWLENRKLTINGGALDFSHAKVREYRMGQIREIVDGYAAHGFEMDFSRQPGVFPGGTGQAKQKLITAMVRRTRQRLDQRKSPDGKRRILIVRVPHTLNLCQYYGFDLGTWMLNGLVDYIVPASPDRYFQFDMPLNEFLALARRTGNKTRVVAGPDSYKATPSMYRAGMANYYAMGQQDTYLFNFFAARAEPRNYYPFRDEDYALLRDLKSPTTLWGRPKHFLASGWFPERAVKLAGVDQKRDVRIYIGEDLRLCQRENILKQATLKVAINGRQPGDQFLIALNGRKLAAIGGKKTGTTITIELTKMLPKVGYNTVSVTATKLTSKSDRSVGRVSLQTAYDLTGATRVP